MDNIIAEGFYLLFFGMGFVVVFLTLLVIATSIMSRMMIRFEPAPVPVLPRKGQSVAANAKINDQTLVAVMSAAIKKYREDRNGQ